MPTPPLSVTSNTTRYHESACAPIDVRENCDPTADAVVKVMRVSGEPENACTVSDEIDTASVGDSVPATDRTCREATSRCVADRAPRLTAVPLPSTVIAEPGACITAPRARPSEPDAQGELRDVADLAEQLAGQAH